MNMSVENIRETFGKGDEIRDRGLTTPEDIKRYDNLSYGQNGTWNLLDIYHLNSVTLCQPAIVSIHGGGWVYGNKELYQYYCMDLAKRGFAVVNFNYRLAPEHPYPQGFEDINTLFSWLMEHAEEYKIDAKNLFVVGDSAGAQLASQYVTLLTNKQYQNCFSFQVPSNIDIKAVALNCGMYDARRFVENGKTEGIVQAYLKNPSEETLNSLDVMNYLTKDFPPTFVATSYYDFLRECASPMHEVLHNLGVISECKQYGEESRQEAAHVFHLNIRLEEAKQCNDDECNFFRRFLHY